MLLLFFSYTNSAKLRFELRNPNKINNNEQIVLQHIEEME